MIKFFRNNKKYIIYIAIVVLIVMILVILFLGKKNNDNNIKNSKYIELAEKYVNINKTTPNTFISLCDLEKSNLIDAMPCDKRSGIYYSKNGYEEFVQCNDYTSNNISKLYNKGKYITLKGPLFIMLPNTEYVEPGYTLKDNRYQVKESIMYYDGIRKITYHVFDKNNKLKEKLTRYVLTPKYSLNCEQDNITLIGSTPYYIIKDKEYIDPGYTATDKNGKNVTDEVRITNNVNTNIPGEYTVRYEYNKVIIIRNVVVSDLSAKVNVSPEEKIIKGSVNIQIDITGNDYSYTELSDGKKSTQNIINTEVNENGEYIFNIYDKYENKLNYTVSVNNIDNVAPTGSCNANLSLGKTIITVNAIDQSGIASYIFNNGSQKITQNTKSYTFNGLYQNTTVTAIDIVGNEIEFKCTNSGDGSLPVIKPNGNIWKESVSESLKVYLTKNNGYYLAHIWVQDPYNQLKKGTTAHWGVSNEFPYDILKREISTHNLQNKIAIGLNGSGFYVLGSWNPNSVSYNNQYNHTSEGALVITNSQVIRNWYYDNAQDRARNNAIYALNQSGKLDVYPNILYISENDRRNLFNNIISKKYINTWTFRPVILENGQESPSIGSFMNGAGKRTIFCQINRNNFVMLSAYNSLEKYKILEILKGANCQTAVNLDGGGSIAMMYKSKSGSLELISGGGRKVVDIIYFTEK